MPKTLNFTLSESDLEIVNQGIKKDKRPEVRQRAIGLRMLHEGHKPEEVAQLTSVSQPTVYDWHHRWQENGLERLANRPKSRLPRKSDEAYVILLEQVVEQDPQELGYHFTIWLQRSTGALLALVGLVAVTTGGVLWIGSGTLLCE